MADPSPRRGRKPFTVVYYWNGFHVRDSGGWFVAFSTDEKKCEREASRLNRGGKLNQFHNLD